MLICRLADFIDLILSYVEISVNTKMETKNCNCNCHVCSEVDAQLAENGIVEGVENLVGSKTEKVVVLTKDEMAVDVEMRRSQGDVRGFSSDGICFGDVDDLEEWLSQVMINDDENPKETETLIIKLPNSVSNSPPHTPPPPTQFDDGGDERLLMGETSMEETSVLPITPLMNGDAKKA